MVARLVIIALVIAGLFLLAPRKAMAETKSNLDEIFKRHANRYGLDWKLLKAIAMQESSLNSRAVNAADPSYGLMQILCTPSSNGVCANKFPAVSNWPPKSKLDLFDPDYNISVGAQILAWNIKTFGMRKGVAVYNSWKARFETEPFSNQKYVDNVFSNYKRLRDESDRRFN